MKSENSSAALMQNSEIINFKGYEDELKKLISVGVKLAKDEVVKKNFKEEKSNFVEKEEVSNIESLASDVEKLKKENAILWKQIELESSNIKVNYVGTLIVLSSYNFALINKGVSIMGIAFEPIYFAGLVMLFYSAFTWKETFLFASSISKKIIGLKKWKIKK